MAGENLVEAKEPSLPIRILRTLASILISIAVCLVFVALLGATQSSWFYADLSDGRSRLQVGVSKSALETYGAIQIADGSKISNIVLDSGQWPTVVGLITRAESAVPSQSWVKVGEFEDDDSGSRIYVRSGPSLRLSISDDEACNTFDVTTAQIREFDAAVAHVTRRLNGKAEGGEPPPMGLQRSLPVALLALKATFAPKYLCN